MRDTKTKDGAPRLDRWVLIDTDLGEPCWTEEVDGKTIFTTFPDRRTAVIELAEVMLLEWNEVLNGIREPEEVRTSEEIVPCRVTEDGAIVTQSKTWTKEELEKKL